MPLKRGPTFSLSPDEEMESKVPSPTSLALVEPVQGKDRLTSSLSHCRFRGSVSVSDTKGVQGGCR